MQRALVKEGLRIENSCINVPHIDNDNTQTTADFRQIAWHGHIELVEGASVFKHGVDSCIVHTFRAASGSFSATSYALR